MRFTLFSNFFNHHQKPVAALLFNEGWRAVANDAMANGCTVLGSNVTGNLPDLIKPNNNCLIFKSGNIEDLTKNVLILYNNKLECSKLALNVYQTISKKWSPVNAAKQLLVLTNSLIKKNDVKLELDEPCGIVRKTSFNWYPSQ